MADYIIVGAGSAGCVLANRLSADPACSVVLIEAGGRDSNFLYRMPAGFFPLMQSGKGNWNFETVPQMHLNNRVLYIPRGKVWGGSSAINGLVVSRGIPSDYDRWAQLGNSGWSFEDCLPHFKAIESYPEGDPALRGHSGPVKVVRPPLDTMKLIPRTFIEAGIQAGHPFNEDTNTGTAFGRAIMAAPGGKALRRPIWNLHLAGRTSRLSARRWSTG
jgi:choline dehydrogenase